MMFREFPDGGEATRTTTTPSPPHRAWWRALGEEARDALVASLHATASAVLEEDARRRRRAAEEEAEAAKAGDGGDATRAVAPSARRSAPASGGRRAADGDPGPRRRLADALLELQRSPRARGASGPRPSAGRAAPRRRQSERLRAALEADRAQLRDEAARLRAALEADRAKSQEEGLVEANSSRRGAGYEQAMEARIREAFPTAVYTNCARTPHAGDGVLFAPDYGLHRCMFEFKAHAKAVGDADVAKLARDLDAGRASFAILATRTANVAGRRDFDVERTPGGKPMLFLVRTDDCPAAVGVLVRLALRFLVRLVTDDDDRRGGGGGGEGGGEGGEGGVGGEADAAQVVQQFTRTYRKLRTQITLFDRQWASLRETLVASLCDLKSVVAPDVSAAGVRRVLRAFRPDEGEGGGDRKVGPEGDGDDGTVVAIESVLDALRHRFPGTTKRGLTKLVRKHPDLCRVVVVRAGTPEWDRLVGRGAPSSSSAKSRTVVRFLPAQAKKIASRAAP